MLLLLLLLMVVLEDVVDDAELLASFLYLSLLSVGMARLRGSPAPTPPVFLTSMLYSPTISMLESESSSRDLREFLDDDLVVVVVGEEVDAAWAIGGGWSW